MEEASRASTVIGLAELALSGCTTVFDNTYVFKNGNNVDCQIQAAKDIGVRFHASRCVEDEPFILRESEHVIKAYHDTSPGSDSRIALAPC
jgi:8-oxoguanine deaminase